MLIEVWVLIDVAKFGGLCVGVYASQAEASDAKRHGQEVNGPFELDVPGESPIENYDDAG